MSTYTNSLFQFDHLLNNDQSMDQTLSFTVDFNYPSIIVEMLSLTSILAAINNAVVPTS